MTKPAGTFQSAWLCMMIKREVEAYLPPDGTMQTTIMRLAAADRRIYCRYPLGNVLSRPAKDSSLPGVAGIGFAHENGSPSNSETCGQSYAERNLTRVHSENIVATKAFLDMLRPAEPPAMLLGFT